MYDRTVNYKLVDIAIYKKKKQAQYKIYNTLYCSKGDRCPSATARLTAAGTQGCLDLERNPLIHIIEERSKESPKLQRSLPIWGTPILTEQTGKMFISDGVYLPHVENASGSYIVASCATTKN